MFHNEQFVIGIAAGVALCALLRFTPTWRELATAMLAASLIDYAVNSTAIRKLAGAGAPFGDVAVYPHVCPCVAVSFIGILAVLHVLRHE